VFISLVNFAINQNLICEAVGLNPDVYLHKFTSSPHDARIQLCIHDAQSLRSVVAGYMFMAQVLRLVARTISAGEHFRGRVIDGL
jgi:hypothetical protein